MNYNKKIVNSLFIIILIIISLGFCNTSYAKEIDEKKEWITNNGVTSDTKIEKDVNLKNSNENFEKVTKETKDDEIKKIEKKNAAIKNEKLENKKEQTKLESIESKKKIENTKNNQENVLLNGKLNSDNNTKIKNVNDKSHDEKNNENAEKLEEKVQNDRATSENSNNIFANIFEIRSQSNGYIIGKINTNRKIDGTKLLLVDEEGKKSETWVIDQGNNNYYFDKNIADCSKDKKYHFEIVEGTENKKVTSINKYLGKIGNYDVEIDDGILSFSKEAIRGNIFEIRSQSNGYIIGKINTNAKIDGSKLLLVDEEGNKSETWVIDQGNNNYYFDKNIADYSKDKKYHFEIVVGKESEKVTSISKNLGKIDNYIVKMIDNNLIFEKIRIIKEEKIFNITNIEVVDNYLKINAEIYKKIKYTDEEKIVEAKIDNIEVVDEQGNKSGTWILNKGNNSYYIDRNFYNYSNNTKYKIVLTSEGQEIQANIKEGRVGILRDKAVVVKDNEIQFDEFKLTTYINIENISTIYHSDYLIMNLNFSRYIENVKTDQEVKVEKLVLSDVDTKSEKELFKLKKGKNSYYADVYIGKIYKDQKYNLIAYYYEGDALKAGIVNIGNRNIGSITRSRITSNDYEINFEKYDGNCRIDIENVRFFNSNGNDYISTVLSVYISDDSGERKTNNISNIYLVERGTNNARELWKKKLDNNRIYADINISGYDKNKKYCIMIGNQFIDNKKYFESVAVYNSDDIGSSNFIKGKYHGEELSFEKIRFEHGIYGKSERGRDLEYYKLGNGNNVAFFTFEMHGFEDNFNNDGAVLVRIADVLKDRLMYENDILNKWTIYIFKSVNPDGVAEGWTRNGPGRTTVNSRIDLNRQWPIPGRSYRRYTDSRNYNGSAPFIAPEAYHLRDFILSHKSNSGQNITVDTHGWLNGTYGDSWIGSFYRNEFGMYKHNNTYGNQYFINWAKHVLPNSRAVLVELPNVWSYGEAMDKGYPDTHARATMRMLRAV